MNVVFDYTQKKKSVGERGGHSIVLPFHINAEEMLDKETLLLSAHNPEVLHLVGSTVNQN